MIDSVKLAIEILLDIFLERISKRSQPHLCLDIGFVQLNLKVMKVFDIFDTLGLEYLNFLKHLYYLHGQVYCNILHCESYSHI